VHEVSILPCAHALAEEEAMTIARKTCALHAAD
jgi:hypothetical protein